MKNLHETPAFKAGMQAGINAMAGMLCGKVAPEELYAARHTLTQDMEIREASWNRI